MMSSQSTAAPKLIHRAWWKESVVYQIYPRSYKDSNGDGVGDIRGIISKLDYIKSLGVDVIWLCPIYQSPNDDNGYDISDYRKLMPEFGTEADFDEMLSGIHSRGMKLMMDLVANHTSDEHQWFQASKASVDNPFRDYYIWRPGKNGGPPNNWKSIFGGSAWEYDATTQMYFLHLFTRRQPDLNWENPEVRQEIYKVIRYWLERGIDGFRMDVISVISKREGLPDSHSLDFNVMFQQYYANGPRVHEYLHEMNQEVLSKYDMMTVGEGPGIDLENGLQYVDRDREELQMIFHFDHMYLDCGPGGKYDPVPVKLVQFKDVFTRWDELLKEKGWGSIYLGNHDFSRMISRFGDDTNYHSESAKLLACLLFTMRGTVYVYQGDEIGMTNIAYPSIDHYNDVETLGYWKEAEAAGKDMDQFLNLVHEKSRDNARTPMQWNDQHEAGFTAAQPWIGVNPNHQHINVQAQQDDPDSILNFYREMIQLRKQHKTWVYGDYQSIANDDPNVYAYRRWDEEHEFLILLNFSNNTIDWTGLENAASYALVKSNRESVDTSFELQTWQAKILIKE